MSKAAKTYTRIAIVDGHYKLQVMMRPNPEQIAVILDFLELLQKRIGQMEKDFTLAHHPELPRKD